MVAWVPPGVVRMKRNCVHRVWVRNGHTGKVRLWIWVQGGVAWSDTASHSFVEERFGRAD